MNNNQIKNPKKEVPTGINMNDCDYVSTVLELEKNISNNYSIALNEASNDYLYEDYFSLLEDSKDIARELYNLMFQYGWYQLEEAEENKILDKVNCFDKKLTELKQGD